MTAATMAMMTTRATTISTGPMFLSRLSPNAARAHCAACDHTA
jgi:hypothetical protein